MKILIGIDGSDNSFAAVALAGRLLDPARDQVALYHACAPVTLGEHVDESLHQRACQAVADVIFDEATGRLPAALQGGVQNIVDKEGAQGALASAAARYGAEMIVLGARGLGRMEGLLLGSVSSNAVRSAPVPVLVVRGKPADAKPLRVLLAYDRIHAEQHAAFLGKLAWPDNAQGNVAAVVEPMLPSHLPDWIVKRARDADTEAMSQVWVREHTQERDAKEQELLNYAKSLPGLFQSGPPIVIEGNPAERLLELIAQKQPSIVVVGKAMKNFFDRWFVGSVSEKILAHANCSVLVIPAATH
jgi:nucleotide-binding universal stress UspA family protein